MLFTSEQVSPGHPDNVCDQISDVILSDCLRNDPQSRVAVETLIKERHVVVAGKITSQHELDVHELVRRVLAARQPSIRDDFDLTVHISKQSPDIAQGVDRKGAGDQGMMFGYACSETHRMLPLPFVLATEAIQYLQQERHPELLPDAKAQCTFDYKRHRIDTFLISTQHKEEVDMPVVQNICRKIMLKIADAYGLNTDYRALVNPTGRFVTGGSFADSGVTGRKIIADTYGGAAHHGGGAFSGKDPTKVDRSAAYMARRIAKDVLRAGYAKRCEIQLSYAIGIEEPVSILVNTFHTGRVPAGYIVKWIRKHYDLTPEGMISFLGLRHVDYNYTSTLGHFWRQWLPWEDDSLPYENKVPESVENA